MPTTQTIHHGLFGANHREVRHSRASAWERPELAKATSYEQPLDHALPDVTIRDPEWRVGDRRDLYALAAVTLSLAVLALAAALLVH